MPIVGWGGDHRRPVRLLLTNSISYGLHSRSAFAIWLWFADRIRLRGGGTLGRIGRAARRGSLAASRSTPANEPASHVGVHIGIAAGSVDNTASKTRAHLVRSAMPTRIHRHLCTAFVGGLLAFAPTCAQAAQTTLSINATIVEVQCTAAQRARIRACAPAQEKYTTEPAKTMVDVQSADRGTPMLEARYEIQLDPTRPVVIRTVLY